MLVQIFKVYKLLRYLLLRTKTLLTNQENITLQPDNYLFIFFPLLKFLSRKNRKKIIKSRLYHPAVYPLVKFHEKSQRKECLIHFNFELQMSYKRLFMLQIYLINKYELYFLYSHLAFASDTNIILSFSFYFYNF